MRSRLRRLAGHLGIVEVVGLAIVLLLLLLAAFGPALFGDWADRVDVAESMQGPSPEHLLGTDRLGRDVLARTLVATRPSIFLALLATLAGASAGVALGALAAVLGPRASRLVGSAITILVAFPPLLLAIFFAVIFGIGATGSVLAIGAAFAPGFARLTQTLAASVAGREYVLQARLLGKSRAYVIVRHVLPNIGEPLLVYGTTHLGIAILALAGLGFLGFGVQPPQFDWGSLLSQGLQMFYVLPSVALGPAVAIAVAGLSFNLVGEKLSDLLAGRRTRRGVRVEPEPIEPEEPSQDDFVLDVRGLRVTYPVAGVITTPVRDVSFRLRTGERLGVVGETGSGKSVTSRAIAQLVDEPGRVAARRLDFLGTDLLTASSEEIGGRLAVVFQDPGGAFNPALRVGTQIREPAQAHLGLAKDVAAQLSVEMLRAVAISEPERRYRQFQHEFSGGMKQRAAIAAGLVARPRLLIADEPTTALDVTVQEQILRLILAVQEETRAALILVSHDIAVVSQVCDRIVVMYAGFLVEDGPTQELLDAPAHPYTAALLPAAPHMDTDRSRALPVIGGRVPGPDVVLPGCYFADRCPGVRQKCRDERPPLTETTAGHRVACWFPLSDREEDKCTG